METSETQGSACVPFVFGYFNMAVTVPDAPWCSVQLDMRLVSAGHETETMELSLAGACYVSGALGFFLKWNNSKVDLHVF